MTIATKISWIATVQKAADDLGIEVPSASPRGMGTLVAKSPDGRRFASIKRRLVPLADAASIGIEWTLWSTDKAAPTPLAQFRDGIRLSQNRARFIASVMHGWLLDKWPAEKLRSLKDVLWIGESEELTETNIKRDFWLSEDQTIGFTVYDDRWALFSGPRSLSAWRQQDNADGGRFLPPKSLDVLCLWLAEHWSVFAFGTDTRPNELRKSAASACRAYSSHDFLHETSGLSEWWSRHAVRAADEELPNIFLERQADTLIISWDAMPSSTRYFDIPTGEESLRADIAIPVLARLIDARLGNKALTAAQIAAVASVTRSDAEAGYSAIRAYDPTITPDWLATHGFSQRDASAFAIAGISRHPIVGLLRSSQGSSLLRDDYELVLKLLQPSSRDTYAKLKELAIDPRSPIDLREPWESGYRLADLVRSKLGLREGDHVDVETLVHQLGVGVHTITLRDSDIRGVCVASPAYRPIVVINNSCEDASGVSGRRITLAHELCHLLFDRYRLRSLARFEGYSSESDRVVEMRANAFAVQLLAPMSVLLDDDGTVADDTKISQISAERQVSVASLRWHADNLRRRVRDAHETL